MSEATHKTQIKVAYITGIGAIIAAIITVLPNFFTTNTDKKELVSPQYLIESNTIKQSEVEFIEQYFSTMKKRPYSESWNNLSPSFIQRKKLTYDNYLSWWKNNIKSIEIINIQKLKNNIVEVKLRYTTNTGTSCSKDKFTLIRRNAKWLINTQEYQQISCNQ